MGILKKPIRRIIRILSGILLTVFAVLVVLYAIFSFVNPKKVLRTFGFQYFVIVTTSMEPVIHRGDIVVIKPLNISDLKQNDIITFYANIDSDPEKEILTHYYDYQETIGGTVYYRTKSEKGLDHYDVTADDIIGAYRFKIPYIGKFIMFIKQPLGIAVIVIDVILIFLIIQLTKDKKRDKTKKEEIKEEERKE